MTTHGDLTRDVASPRIPKLPDTVMDIANPKLPDTDTDTVMDIADPKIPKPLDLYAKTADEIYELLAVPDDKKLEIIECW